MAGKFVLKKGRTGKFSFNLCAGNGQVVLTSETYNTKKSAENGIASVGKNCGTDKFYDRKVAKNGKPYFTLKAGNGQVIGKSQMYSSNAAMEKGIASVKANGGSRVDDQT
ncbi:MAG: YegP family protein [Actinomycetota bacterium]